LSFGKIRRESEASDAVGERRREREERKKKLKKKKKLFVGQ